MDLIVKALRAALAALEGTAAEPHSTAAEPHSTAPKRRGRPAMNLAIALEGSEEPPVPVRKFPAPRVGAVFPLTVNGTPWPASTTQWKDMKYTYFAYRGCPMRAAGHLDPTKRYELTYPDSYDFTPLARGR